MVLEQSGTYRTMDEFLPIILEYINIQILAGVDPVSLIVYAVYAIAIGFSIYSVQRAKELAKKAQQFDTRSKQSGTLYQVRAGALPRRIPYGYVRSGAIDTYVASYGPNNQWQSFIVVWGEGPIEGIANLLFDGVNVDLVPIDEDNPDILIADPSGPYAGCIRFETELGDNDLPPPHGRDIIPTWGDIDTNILYHVAYSWLELKFDPDKFPKGVPNISAILLGRNDIWDPRDETFKYTNNVALCLNHYLKLQKVGPGLTDEEIGQDELIEAAQVCEELVEVPAAGTGTDVDSSSGGSSGATEEEFRYTFNGVIELSKTAEQIIELFRTAMAGVTVYIGGKLRIYAGAYSVPTFEITKDYLVGPVRRKTRTSKGDRINKVRGVYANASTLWVPTDFPSVPSSGSPDEVYAEEDKEELAEDIDLLNCDSPYRAQRIASIMLRKSRYGREVNLQCHIEAWRAQPGRTVLFHFPEIGFEHVPMDVLAMGMSIKDNVITVNLTLRETNPYIYEEPPYDRKGNPPDRPDNEPPQPEDPEYPDLMVLKTANVGISCKGRDGVLSLCGFEEFTDVSTPPKKFRRRRVEGQMEVTEFHQDGNTTCDPEVCSDGLSHSFSNAFSVYGGGPYSGSYSLSIDSETDTTITYIVNSFVWSGPESAKLELNGVHTLPGQTRTYNKGGEINVGVSANYLFWGFVIGSAICFIAGAVPMFTDDWEYEAQYDASDCSFSETDGSSRTPSEGSPVSPIPEAPPNYRPDQVYAPNLSGFLLPIQPTYTETGTLRLSRTTSGLGCVPGIDFGPKSMLADGEVIESLEDEDTEDDAILRFQNANPWSGFAWVPCSNHPCCRTEYQARTTGFDFYYAEARIKVDVEGGTEYDIQPLTFTVIKVFFNRINLTTEAITPYAAVMVLTGITDALGNLSKEEEVVVERGYAFQTALVQVFQF